MFSEVFSAHRSTSVHLLLRPSSSPTPSDSTFCILPVPFPLKYHGDHSISAHINLSHSFEKLNSTFYGLLKDTEVVSSILLVLKIMHKVILYIQDWGQHIQEERGRFLVELLHHLAHALNTSGGFC